MEEGLAPGVGGTQGSFLEHNSYVLRDHVPWYVAFVVSGDLAGRADPHFDSSLEISPELLSEWRRFHTSRHNPPPVVAVHFPLDGEHLLRAMARLGLGSHTLSRGTAAYLSTLARVAPFRECYVPMPFLAAVEAEAAAPPPFPEQGRKRLVPGGWLAATPQSRWSQRHMAVDGREGFLSYARVYPTGDDDWDRSVDVLGDMPTPQQPPDFAGISDWLGSLRQHGLRIVPVLAATEAHDASAQALAARSQETAEPRGLIFQNAPDGRLAAVPEGWWELSKRSAGSQLRLDQ
jgi:hypothetical protein